MKQFTLEVLRALSHRDFLSGEDLAHRFNCSRATIWNAVQELQEQGFTIESVRGRGYRLESAMDWIDGEALTRWLRGNHSGIEVDLLPVVVSTNSEALARAVDAGVDRLCVAAEIQTGGRGRRGRAWASSAGGALTFSVIWRFAGGIATLSGLSLAVGVGILRGFERAGIKGLQLKWPNDILYQFQKVAGILIELQGDVLGPTVAVIGIGVNTRLDPATRDQIDQAATDLASIAGEGISRTNIFGHVLLALEETLLEFVQHGFDPFRAHWESRHIYHEKDVRLLSPNGTIATGKVCGVDADGSLILETGHGRCRFGSGELSLRRLE